MNIYNAYFLEKIAYLSEQEKDNIELTLEFQK